MRSLAYLSVWCYWFEDFQDLLFAKMVTSIAVGGISSCFFFFFLFFFFLPNHHLVVLVVKASTSGVEVPGFESCLRRDFFLGRVIPVT